MRRSYNQVFLTVYFIGVISLFFLKANAQSDDSLRSITKRFEQYQNNSFQEKLFLHSDRTFYLTGDYIWFKVYVVDGTHHELADLSKVAYIEIVDRDNKPVLQGKLTLDKGMGSSSLFLPASLSSGRYILRAYTRWMQNFSPQFYFHKTITIINPFKPLQQETNDQLNNQYDVQFFPEGGDMVVGIESKVAFRVVDKQGKGVSCNGWLIDQDYDTLAEFHSLKFGLGNFKITPSPGKIYRALIKDHSGSIISMKELPSPKNYGYGMQLREDGNRLLISVQGRFSDESLKIVHLVAHTRGEIVNTATKALHLNAATFIIEKNLLRGGVTHMTIFDENNHPVCERLFFKEPESLVLSGSSDKGSYLSRQKVSVKVSVKNEKSEFERSDLSVAVYRLDSLQVEDPVNIRNYLQLTSELKGAIESPGYYFTKDKDVKDAVDNLMLTHGWRRFQWNDILTGKPQQLSFIPEYRSHLVMGSVTHEVTGEPGINIPTYLSIPGKHFQLRGTKSSREGEIRFELKDFYGPNKMIVQTNTQVDSVYKIKISNPFSDQFAETKLYPFNLPEKFAEQLVTRSVGMQLENAYFEQSRAKIQKLNRDTIAFYGKPDEHYRLDDFTRFPVMEEVMREYVPGILVRKRKKEFYFITLNDNSNTVFRENPLVLLDGIPVFRINSIMEYDPLKVNTLDVITKKYFYGPLSFPGLASYQTYNGDYPDFPIDIRALVIDYDGMLWDREFFSPVYETTQEQNSRLPDFRNLLFWSPSVKTDAKGEANVQFYTSDQPGLYLVNIQGLAEGGLCGSNSFTFEVVASPSN